jgi:hypothetical protein
LDDVKKKVVGHFSTVFGRLCGPMESRTAIEVIHT